MKLTLELNTSMQNVIQLFRFLEIDPILLNIKLDENCIPELNAISENTKNRESVVSELLFDYFKKKFNITKEEIKSKNRKRELTLCRTYYTVFMLSKFKYLSLKSIGNDLGNRDHSTIINLRNNHRDDCETNKKYLKESTVILTELETLINQYEYAKNNSSIQQK